MYEDEHKRNVQQITEGHNISQRFTPSLKQSKNSFLFSVKND